MTRVVTILCVCVLGVIAQADLVSQPYIAGNFQEPEWQAGDTPMNSLGDGIWEYTITGTPGAYQQFKITTGSWDDPTAPASNSWYTIPASGEVVVTFNTNIVSDGWLPEQFRVGVSTDPGSWSLVGDFNGWNNNDPAQLMSSLGGGIYMLTQTLPAGDWQIKPVNTGSWDGIGTDGRSIDAQNLNLSLATATEVTIYVDAFAGTLGTGDTITLNQAFDPVPANAKVVGANLAALSWTNPDPNNPADTITSDVYFLDAGTSQLTQDPNMGPILKDIGVVQIANDITAETVAISGLVDDHYYYWAVHSTDPNDGGPVTIQGYTWYFYTGDAAPIPGQPVAQYMWLSQDDSAIGGFGDTNPNVRYFEVTATYTDDDKSTVVDANFVNLSWGWDPATGELGVTEVSDVFNPVTKTATAIYKTEYHPTDPNFTTVLPGNWNIRLDVTDGTGRVQGTSGHHEIWETCKEAAAADPTDNFDGHYDSNGDCIVSLPDFADFAEKWLYQGAKYE